MAVIGYLLSILMGLTLGLLGGGGSILTVPILVYAFGVDPVLATAYSLFIVGLTALLGGLRKSYEGWVNWKTGLVFALPSLVAVFLTRYYLIPALPEMLIETGSFRLSKDMAIMSFFAFVMLLASYSMIFDGKKESSKGQSRRNYLWIVLDGLFIGAVTGFVGAGGGFLIVPALVVLLKMPVKEAIGTSLIIIAIKSLIGFSGDIIAGQVIEWNFLMLFTAFALVGMTGGIILTRYVKPGQLKRLFGFFVLVMAIYILIIELF